MMTHTPLNKQDFPFLTPTQFSRYAHYREQIQPRWYFRPNGIHGVGHIKRVLLYVILLADDEGIDETGKDLLCLAAIYHDIGRQNDRVDPLHGAVSVAEIKELHLPRPDDKQQQHILDFIIDGHCRDDQFSKSDENMRLIQDKAYARKLYDIFKDADALDRVRLNAQSLDVSYLRCSSAKRYIQCNIKLLDIITNEKN